MGHGTATRPPGRIPFRGDIEGLLHQLDAALELDPRFGPALVQRGFVAWIQGDDARARQLLEAVDHWVAWMIGAALDLAEPLRVRVPRNPRCPCGSGAKSKHCCRGAVHSPGIEGRLLWLKLQLWLTRFPQD